MKEFENTVGIITNEKDFKHNRPAPNKFRLVTKSGVALEAVYKTYFLPVFEYGEIGINQVFTILSLDEMNHIDDESIYE